MPDVMNGVARGSPSAPPGLAAGPDEVTAAGAAATAPTGLAAPRLSGPPPAAGRAAGGAVARPRGGFLRALLAGPAGRALAGPAGLVLADLAALAAAAVASGAVASGAVASGAVAVSGAAVPLLAAYAVAVLAVLAGGGAYRPKLTPRAADQAGRMVAAATVPALVLLVWLPAGPVLRLALAAASLLACGRAAAYAVIRAARRRGLAAEPALVIGAGETGQQLAAILLGHPELGLHLTGYLDSRPAPDGSPVPVLGRPADLAAVVARHGIRRVIVAFPAAAEHELVPVLRAARGLPAEVWVVPRLPEVGTGLPRASLDEAWGIPLVPLRRPGRGAALAKRGFDVTAALVLLMLTAPLLLAFGLAVRLRLRRPALFRQTRVTGQGRLAEIVKLRTVTVQGDPDTCWVVPPGQATVLGRFLRATHLDELPQLLNVLRGDMSLVGPRPERPFFARRFEAEIPGYAGRHRMTAGLTGWAQVHGLNGDTSISDRARFDNAYIENWSLWLDLVILARTAAASLWAAIARSDDGLSRAGRAAAAPAPAAPSWDSEPPGHRGRSPVPAAPSPPPPGQTSPVSPSGGSQ